MLSDIILILFSYFCLFIFIQLSKSLISGFQSMINKGSFSLEFGFWNKKIFLNFRFFVFKGLRLLLELLFLLFSLLVKIFFKNRSPFNYVFWFIDIAGVYTFNCQISWIHVFKWLNVFCFIISNLGFVFFGNFFGLLDILLFLFGSELFPLSPDFRGYFSDRAG